MVILGNSIPADAAASSTLNFQGMLASNTGGKIADGSYNIEFNLYSQSSGGSSIWTETHLNNGGNGVTVRNGYFSVYLGDSTTGNPFTSDIPWDQELWLGMTIRGSGSCTWGTCTPTDSEMTPRFRMSAVPYAFRAGAVTDSAGNAYTADDLAQLAPASVQAVNSALAALRLNQTGSGSLLQLQGDGTDVFTVNKSGGTLIAGGLTLGNSSLATAGTIRWTGTDFEGYDGSDWVSLTQGSGGGGGGVLTYDSFFAYDATGAINIAAGWTDITLDTEVKEDTPFTHGADAATVTLNEDGWYEISYNLSAYTTSGGNNQVTAAAKLQEDTGSGFVDIGGSFGYATVTSAPADGNIAVTVTRQFTAGDIVKLQAQRATGSITMLTRPNSAGLTIRKVVEAGGGGGSTTAFEQSGNAFGVTAVLGTTDANGLDIITSGSTAMSFTTAGAATLHNGLTISSGGLVLASGDISTTNGLSLTSGTGDVTIASGTGLLILDASTLQRSASGTLVFDLLDSSGATALSILNSDSGQVANLAVEGTVSATSFNGSGSGLTALSADNISSGTLDDSSLSANVTLLDQNQTFTGVPTFGSGLVLSGSSSTTAGAIRWSGTDFEGYDGIEWVSFTTGGGGGGGGGSTVPAQNTVVKSSDETVNNSTALQNDNELLFPVGANETWAFRFVVQASSGTIPDIKFAVTAPSGAICMVSFSDPEGATSQSNLGCGVSTASIPGNGANDLYEITGSVVNGVNAGNVTLQWAQFTADPSNTIVRAGSYVLATIDGGGQVFLQGGNDFGSTAILGTTGNNGLNFITNNTTALALDASGQATFSGLALLNDGVTIGNEASDSFTIASSAVSLTNGLNFDTNTFVIDASNNRVAIGTGTATNQLTINGATVLDSSAVASIATNGTADKGLIIQGTASQAANLFEVQNSSGTTLAGFNAAGELLLGQTTLSSSATLGRSITLPDASGTICLSSSTLCGYIRFAAGVVQTDASTADTIAINKTNASGNLLALQRGGGAVFTVANTGSLQIQSTASEALDIRNVGGTSFFSVDTNTGLVRVGPSAADGNGVLFVLDTKNTSGDPSGTNGGMYYNSSTGKFRCYEGGIWKDCINSTTSVRSFIDSVSDAVVDANTTNYWDPGTENNSSTPNIILSAASGQSVMGMVTMEVTSSSNADTEVTARVERGIGSVPTCGSGTTVGGQPGVFSTNTGAVKSSTVTFLDSPNTTSTVYYVLCSDTTTAGTNATVTRIRFTLQEVTNSN